MPFRLYQSNDLAALARRFRDTLRNDPLPPMEKEIILVQSIGMGRWISLFMAEAFGAWANFRYIYPNVFLDTAFRAAFDGYDPGKLISKDETRWLIHSVLPSLSADRVYAPLRGYAGDANELKRFQLAGKIADLFDQYLTSRPEMICAWDEKHDTLIAGEFTRDLADDEKWQSALWRRITAKRKNSHRAYLREQLARNGFPLFAKDELPKRLSVFGVSTLFPFHLDILEALSFHVDVTMYVLSPSREYIADILPAKLRARTARKLAAKGVSAADAHIDRGNALVASLGSLARDFQNTLLSRSIDDLTSDGDFRDPGDGTLLAAIQSDILNLRDRRKKIMIDPEDESVRIASCYGPRREVEALHDYLTHLLNEHAKGADALNPRDILVMTVDIDTYAPYIESVFGAKKTEENGVCFIPYSIADRNIRAQSALSRGFDKIFSLQHRGFAASAVIDFLLLPPVKAKFGFTEDDFEIIRGWIERAAIRWGRDETDRMKRCGEPFSEFSWAYGIDRLMMGFSAGETGLDLIEGISPACGIEGSEYDLLSRFMSVYERLTEVTDFCAEPHAVDEWKDLFSSVVDEFFDESDEYSWEFESFREALSDYASGAAKASFSGAVGLQVALDVLFGALADHAVQYGFLNGRVTFCAMLPMRSVPFRVIAVLGLDDGAFPLSTKLPTFDLMGKHPAAGDRSKRNDDRYLFLETIMSAGDYLYLSYNGRSPYDNSARPPSVILRELTEYIRDNFDIPGGSGEDLVKAITVDHHLHLFNPAYFGAGDRLYSYSSVMCDIASAGTRNRAAAAFESGLSEEIPGSFDNLSPDELKNFFRKPVRWFCTERLGLRLPRSAASLRDEEPLEMEFEDRLALSDMMIRRICAGESASECFDLARASGMVPPLEYGMKELEELAADAEKVGSVMRALMTDAQSARGVDFSCACGGRKIRVRGDVTDIFGDRIVRGRMTRWSTDDVDMWIDHLLVCAAGTPVETVFVSRDGIFRHMPVEKAEAKERLSELVSVYRRGLVRPVHLFPKSSCEYAADYIESGDSDKSLNKARAAWMPNAFRKGVPDSEDPYHFLCFGGHPGYSEGGYPLDDEFAELSVLVYGKLLAAREESDE